MKKLIFSLPITVVLLLLAFGNTKASNGEATLRNVVGSPSVCHVNSVLTPDSKYTVLIICSDLIYPPSSETLHYIVWANPEDGGNAIKLGDLGLGTAEFKISKKIVSLFVTQEQQAANNVNKPGTVVMTGNLAPFADLRITSQQPIDQTPTPMPTPRTSSSSSLIAKLTGGALITVISIVIIIVMLFLVKPFK